LTPALVRLAGMPSIVLLHNIMETVDLKQAGFGGGRLMETAIRASGNLFTRALLKANLVALTIPKYVELIEAKFGAGNVLLAPHGAFDETAMPSLDPPDHGQAVRILTFGKFGTYKRVEVLIEALQLLHRDGRARPPLELVIAGTDSPNAAGYLADIARRYEGVPGIHMTGYVEESDIARIFAEASVVAFPYTSTTGSSGVLHQTGNYARAAVLPQLGDLKELLEEEGYAGEYFTPEDPVSLAAALARVIDHPERRRELGRHNHLASQGLPLSDVVDWYLLHIDNLLQRKNSKHGHSTKRTYRDIVSKRTL
jgi:glycosyltransferase involved in cell wall biosynthesis